MIRAFLVPLLAATAVFAQAPANTDLIGRTQELQDSIAAGDWKKASDLSRDLKAAVTEARNQSLAAKGIELTDTILNWLPPDTETLVVASRPFAIPAEDRTKVPSAIEYAQGYLLGPPGAAEKGELTKALKGRTIRLAILGARRFGGDPSDLKRDQAIPLGMIPYEGCGIYAFAEPLPDSLISRQTDDLIAGHRVWTSKGTQNDTPDRDTYLVSLLQPDLISVCNNREFFQQMVLRIGSAQNSRAFPPDLPEWKQLDRTAPLWAISHYRHDSPLLKMFAKGNPAADPEAVGITIEFGLPSGATRSRMISKSDPWKMFTDTPEFHNAVQSRKVSDGVWELSVSGDPEAAGMTAFVLMGLIGLVVFV